MPELILHARSVETVFDLLGQDENDMTAALGWALARSSELLRRFAQQVAPGATIGDQVLVELQRHDAADGGFTDIELRAPGFHVIVEAKRGWALPSDQQLRRYEARLATFGSPIQAFVVLTQNGVGAIVRNRLSGWGPPRPVEKVVLGWSDVVGLAAAASRNSRAIERHLTDELATYLRGVADMRDARSHRRGPRCEAEPSIGLRQVEENSADGEIGGMEPPKSDEDARCCHGGPIPRLPNSPRSAGRQAHEFRAELLALPARLETCLPWARSWSSLSSPAS